MGAGRDRWNLADLWEAVAARFPDRNAQVSGDRRFTWRQFEARAEALARTLLAAGVPHQGTVAHYLYNGPEYLEAHFACFKAALIPVNTNYRYTAPELRSLWDDAGISAVVFHSEFAGVCAGLRAQLPAVSVWICAGPPDLCPEWALPYEEAVRPGSAPAPVETPVRRGSDLWLLYTGGTTGRPKGVMWPQDSLFRMLETSAGRGVSAGADIAGYLAGLGDGDGGPTGLPAPPLMHGTASWYAMALLCRGGCVVTVPSRRFDAAELLDVLERERVTGTVIVGDAFARPLVELLDREPTRWDLSQLRAIVSSGVMFSRDLKEAFLRHAPGALIVDNLGSSESGAMGRSTTSRDGVGSTASFVVNDRTRVIDDQGLDVVPGSGRPGRLAVGGILPLGYWNDPEKTAETFLEIDGRRYVVAGDWAEVGADGTIHLFGRGSLCINTGGEKVFPEEVETSLKRHPAVADAVVVGLPDERFGEIVAALVSLTGELDDLFDELATHVKAELAGYKAPRFIAAVPDVGRTPNGKLDYRSARQRALDLRSSSPGRPAPAMTT